MTSWTPDWEGFWAIALRVAARKMAEEAGAKIVRVWDGDKVIGYLDLRGGSPGGIG